MGNKRNRKKKSYRKHDDDANREKQKLRNTAKRARVAETEEINEDIRTYLHDNVDEMEIENRVQEEQMEVEKTIVDVNSDLHVNVDEVNIEDQNQVPEIGPSMYISCIFEIHFYNELYFWTYVKFNLIWCIGTFTIDDEILEDIDYDKYEEKLPIHIARYRATKIYDDILKDYSITGKAQILRCLLVSKC